MKFWKRRRSEQPEPAEKPLEATAGGITAWSAEPPPPEMTETAASVLPAGSTEPALPPLEEVMETAASEPQAEVGGLFLRELLPQLQRLDRLLERAAAVAQAVYGAKAAADPFRGLHISQSEVEQLLAREPGAPTLRAADLEETLPAGRTVPWRGLPQARRSRRGHRRHAADHRYGAVCVAAWASRGPGSDWDKRRL